MSCNKNTLCLLPQKLGEVKVGWDEKTYIALYLYLQQQSIFFIY